MVRTTQTSGWFPHRSAASAWSDDAFARGSYSYLGVGSTPADVECLAAPLGDGALRFAGEATSREHLATAAGARAPACESNLQPVFK